MTLDTKTLRPLFAEWARLMQIHKQVLTELDNVVGDGDLGLTMSDGFAAVNNAVQRSDEHDIGRFFYSAGKAMASAVPSTMGTLMASGLMQAGKIFKGHETFSTNDAGEFFQAWYDGVQQRGRAQPGEKTFLDGMAPALITLKAPATMPVAQAQEALYQAQRGVQQTTTMVAKHGRAAIHGERSRTFVDPGAMVARLLIQGYFNFIQAIFPVDGQ
ncbi:dihydroxyacetone kinase subunit L [Salmonella enterica]|uniref:Dihydroxyacetone kinase subunit L n=2 Tax=Salmonella enterica TaxID=28901 RepID=A0A5V3YJY7_SALER|nr:dihydroxyacetone kinase subunit L [Salmonella enterica]EBR8572926.1 dihydroxyacetone kinase subunit L [Salmonella enterica subsp. enterica serovar Java]EBW7308909.1 dihydroxyacetone kinase subunit L [Salmonella enterica subsp. enterica serovar Enteritidis]EBW9700576.1 dihydroxyacetone kinase subunit L [Salmonella enterica subsp. enterica serovar Oranienburg]EKN5803832.1 dihydroxyacetone kinase subunit L [Salmonella enterica subsp. enterica]